MLRKSSTVDDWTLHREHLYVHTVGVHIGAFAVPNATRQLTCSGTLDVVDVVAVQLRETSSEAALARDW